MPAGIRESIDLCQIIPSTQQSTAEFLKSPYISEPLVRLVDGYVHDSASGEVYGGLVDLPGFPLRDAAKLQAALHSQKEDK